MFEQMGATVSWDAGSKTATVSKPGAEVKVTVGKPEVMINGESRPLDVPPMMYQGAVLVPVRVISEGMGAYVLWVADRRLVVVRYIPATPPPAPAPPPPAPPPPPPPPPTHPPNVFYLAGDYIINPRVYNQFSNGNRGGTGSYTVRGAVEFNAIGLPFMLAADYTNWQYPHGCGVPITHATPANAAECFVVTVGSRGIAYVPAFTAVNRNIDVRLGYKVFEPKVYIAVAYMWASNNYGYPNQDNIGFGIEKLPDYGQKFQYYGSVYYFPSVSGTYTTAANENPPNTSFGIGYNVLKYNVGIGWAFVPNVFIDIGWTGEAWANRNNAPIGMTMNGPYAGLGFLLPF
jgi:hypothetical protein